MRTMLVMLVAAAGWGVAPAPAGAGPVVAPILSREARWELASAARRESLKKSSDFVVRSLARGDIKPGDPIEPLIRDYPRFKVLRYGRFVALTDASGFGGTTLFALDGKLACASTSSCTFRHSFFNTLTGKEHGAAWTGYGHAKRQQADDKRRQADLPTVVPAPREAGPNAKSG